MFVVFLELVLGKFNFNGDLQVYRIGNKSKFTTDQLESVSKQGIQALDTVNELRGNDTADKKMIVEMVLWAYHSLHENMETANMIVITSDIDFLNAIELVQKIGFNVILSHNREIKYEFKK